MAVYRLEHVLQSYINYRDLKLAFSTNEYVCLALFVMAWRYNLEVLNQCRNKVIEDVMYVFLDAYTRGYILSYKHSYSGDSTIILQRKQFA